MKPHSRALHLTMIRLIKGIITAWERWLNEEYASGLPEGTPEDAVRILAKGRKP